ncbi:MAG: four helix bundle protein [bacterium]|nr:four helix bundle protein [bacterium]
MAEKETIVTKMYDLVKYLMIVVNRFPRDYKFTLGDRIAQFYLTA